MGHSHHSDSDSDENSPCCGVSDAESTQIIENIIAKLRDMGMRKTEALEELLQGMLASHKPFLLSELSELPGLADRDQATVYRLVTKLKDLGMVRQLNFGDKGNFFQLNVADHHHDYMLCQECSEISEVPYPCALREIEEKLRSEHGWGNLSHSLAFHGICPKCHDDDSSN